MATALTVNVQLTRPNRILLVVNHLVSWAILLGAIGLSKQWFGGSWVIDLSAFMLATLVFLGGGMTFAGKTVSLTRGEAAEWVRDGQPDDVKGWKRDR